MWSNEFYYILPLYTILYQNILSMNILECLERFLTYLRLHKWRSMRTLEQYESHIWKFIVFLDPKTEMYPCKPFDHREAFLDTIAEKRIENREIRWSLKKHSPLQIEQIKKEDVDDFRLHLHKNWLSIKTTNAYMITLRSWFKFLKKEQFECLDPTVIDLMKSPDREVTFLTDDEIKEFFLSIDQTDIQWIRDFAICECIYSTWLRISELTALNRKDVNFETLEFAIRGKWNKLRTVYLTETASDAIQKYLELRADSFSPLFIRHNFSLENINSSLLQDDNVRLSRFFITNMVKDYGLKAGILKNIHAHSLRHSFATTLLTNGADIRIIQELLWHASITTTQVYTHVTNPKLKEAHKKFHNW